RRRRRAAPRRRRRRAPRGRAGAHARRRRGAQPLRDPARRRARRRARRPRALAVEMLGAHTVSTGFRAGVAPERSLASAVTVAWPPAGPERHVAAARALADLARATGVTAVDLGGGHPPQPGLAAHAETVAEALRHADFGGRLLLEPGRAIV